jgi:hypothetical protein
MRGSRLSLELPPHGSVYCAVGLSLLQPNDGEGFMLAEPQCAPQGGVAIVEEIIDTGAMKAGVGLTPLIVGEGIKGSDSLIIRQG